MISRLQLNGVRRLFLFKSLCRYSTTAPPVQPPQSCFLVDYLVNSLGFSKDEALSATKKVVLYKSSRNDPDMVVNLFQKLGLDKTQIRSIVSADPRLLTYNVDKTLQPKILALQEIGISGSDLTAVLMTYKTLLAGEGLIRPQIECLRNLLGSNEYVAEVIRKYSSVLRGSLSKWIVANVELLQKHGLSKEILLLSLVKNPRSFVLKPQRLEEVLYMVENELGINHKSKMFYNTVLGVSSISKIKFDMKVAVLRSFGFSNETVYSMIKQYPSILRTSGDKMRKTWNFFTREVGHEPDFLAAHPVIFNLSLQNRVIPRYEILKILNEKKLKKGKLLPYKLLHMSELAFMNDFVLPYVKEIPESLVSNLKIGGRKKTRKL